MKKAIRTALLAVIILALAGWQSEVMAATLTTNGVTYTTLSGLLSDGSNGAAVTAITSDQATILETVKISGTTCKVISIKSTGAATSLTYNGAYLERIEASACENNTKIQRIDITSPAFNFIGYKAFKGATNLKHIFITTGATNSGFVALFKFSGKIDSYAFDGCTGLVTDGTANGLYITSDVQSIGAYAFNGCTGLTRANVYVKEIPSYAFNGCTKIATINIFNATAIAPYAFYNCTGLTTVSSSQTTSLETIGQGAFMGSGITSFSATNATTVADYAFKNCTKLETAVLSQATSIGAQAFYGCTSLTDVDMAKVQTIGNYAFKNCSSLNSLYIPTTATSISYDAFDGCSGMTKISIASTKVLTNSMSPFKSLPLQTLFIASGATEIGAQQFQDMTSLSYLNINSSCTKIGISAFEGCTALSTVNFSDLPAGCIIENKAFSKTGVTDVTLNGVKVYEQGFANCKSLKNVTLKNACTLAFCSFANCTALETADIDVTAAGNRSFAGCDHLQTVTLRRAYDSGFYSFEGCTGEIIYDFPFQRIFTASADPLHYSYFTTLTINNVPGMMPKSFGEYGTRLKTININGATDFNGVTTLLPTISHVTDVNLTNCGAGFFSEDGVVYMTSGSDVWLQYIPAGRTRPVVLPENCSAIRQHPANTLCRVIDGRQCKYQPDFYLGNSLFQGLFIAKDNISKTALQKKMTMASVVTEYPYTKAQRPYYNDVNNNTRINVQDLSIIIYQMIK